MTRFQGKIGEQYDLITVAVQHLPYLEKLLGKEIQKYAANLAGPIKVFEFGCGTGITTEEILAAHQNITVVAVDNENATLAQAQKNLAKYSNRVKFLLVDGLDYLKQEAQQFDVFASAFCLHNLNQDYRFEVLQEAYRILKNNGLFVNTDKYACSDPLQHQKDLAWQLKRFDKYDQIGKPELKTAWVKHYQEDEAPEKIMLIDQAFQEMQQIGFKEMQSKARIRLETLVTALK